MEHIGFVVLAPAQPRGAREENDDGVVAVSDLGDTRPVVVVRHLEEWHYGSADGARLAS
jgi:hypothetical protein